VDDGYAARTMSGWQFRVLEYPEACPAYWLHSPLEVRHIEVNSSATAECEGGCEAENPMTDSKNHKPEGNGKLKRKEYERELARLHVEFVKLQQWVVHKGLKVCIAVSRP
jgi:polyphosphate kinase 2 (PPK2 family)